MSIKTALRIAMVMVLILILFVTVYLSSKYSHEVAVDVMISAAFVIAALLGAQWLVHKYSFGKIERMSLIIDSIVAGGFTQRIDVDINSKNEIDKMAIAINKAVEEVENLTKSLESKVANKVKQEKEDFKKYTEEVEKFKLALDNALSGIVITTPDHKIVYANKAVSKVTGYSNSELVGATPKLFRGEDTKEEVYKNMFEAIYAGESFSTEEMYNKKKNGTIYNALLSVYPIMRDGKPQYFVGVQTDITARKKTERARVEFVSIAGHQLRTPLSAIRWYLEDMLNDPGGMSMKQMENVAGLHKTTLRIIELVNSMLDTSRVETGTMLKIKEDIDIAQVFNDTVREQKINADKNNISVKLDIKNSDRIRKIISDSKSMRMMVENLLSNAIKYTPPGGNVMISLQDVNGEFEGQIFQERGFGFYVKDDGIGIPEDQQHRVFEKMFRADNARAIETDGTGLGLYTIKLVIEEAGGKIWFTSKGGNGATFYVYMPYSVASDNEPEKHDIMNIDKINKY